MKKTLIKYISLILTAILMCAVSGCSDKTAGPDGNGSIKYESPKNPMGLDYTEDVNGGIHNYSVGTTDYNLVLNGNCGYKIIIPSEASNIVKTASTELISFWSEATGIILPCTDDSASSYFSESQYISVGDTTLLSAAGITVDRAELTTQGFVIVTKGQSVFIIGGGSFGTLFGTYEFLHQALNFKVYSADTYTLNTNVKNLALPSFDIKDVPDIEFRASNFGTIYYNNTAAHRMKMIHTNEVFMPGTDCHNTLRLLKPDVYYPSHPLWYEAAKKQLCYTAHGNPEEYEALVSEMVSIVEGIIDANKDMSVLSITQEDINVWCGCDSCTALKNRYGTDAGSQIIFINEIAKRIEEWLDAERGGRDVTIVIFAYHKTEKPPVKKLESGEYAAIDGAVNLRSNVALWFAPLSADFINSLSDSENIGVYDSIKAWSAITDNFFLWSYNTYFAEYLIPFNSFNSMQDNYKIAMKYNTEFIFDQGAYNSLQCTAFCNLKVFLSSELQWNVNGSYNALVDEFFTNYFQAASVPMRKFFDSLNVQFYYQKQAGLEGNVWAGVKNTKYWPKRVLAGWLNYINEAYESIAYLKETNPELYSTLYGHICNESIAIRYLLIELYSGTYSQTDLKAMKASFKDDAERLNVTRISEGTSFTQYVGNWD